MCQASRIVAEILLRQDRPWESNYIGLNQVIYDQNEGLFKMWYRRAGRFTAQKGGDRI